MRSFPLLLVLAGAPLAAGSAFAQPRGFPDEPPNPSGEGASPPTAEAADSPTTGPTEPVPAQPEPADSLPPDPFGDASTAGPDVELSTEHEPPARDQEQTPPESARFESFADRTAGQSATVLGGYGELHFNMKNIDGPGERHSELDMHRLVLALAHTFSDELRFVTEIEIEHSVAADGAPGEVAVEQAYVDYLMPGGRVGVRAGVVLVPMGIINQWHEPPSFHGVERPNVDKVIIPSTWREAAVGLFGEPSESFRYELYVMSGLDPSGFSGPDGIRGGRQEVAEARVDGVALAGRAEFEPSLGVVAGISGYIGEAGPNADFFDSEGNEVELNVPVYGLEGDLRARYEGLESRTVLAFFHVGDTDDLRNAFDAEGESLGIDMGESMLGMYIEFAYDILYGMDTDHELLPFVRAERYDTMLSLKGRNETLADESLGRTDWLIGLSYRPVPQVAFKTDYVFKDTDGTGGTSGQFDLGLGVMF